jgi:site-specific DNA-methyltransferase (adenine-specific)
MLKTLPDESVDSCVTDPPYGLGTREPTASEIVAYLQGAELKQGGDFMGKKWDVPSVAVWKECYRVLKPGGHVLSFGGTRTFDLISVGLRTAGFECRDTIAQQFGVMCLQWIQGQGFPKSRDPFKSEILPEIERQLKEKDPGIATVRLHGQEYEIIRNADGSFTLPPEVEKLKGLGTALKPSWEPILVFRKPIAEKTVAKQVLKTGTGALHIDACRVRMSGPDREAYTAVRESFAASTAGKVTGGWANNSPAQTAEEQIASSAGGRWPANLLLTHTEQCRLVGTERVAAPVINRFTDGAKPFGNGAGHDYESEQRGDADGKEAIPVYECEDGCPVKALDEQSGERGVSGSAKNGTVGYRSSGRGFIRTDTAAVDGYVPPNDSGGASRYFNQFEYECADGCPVKELGEQSGISTSVGGRLTNITGSLYGEFGKSSGLSAEDAKGDPGFGDTGTAARYFNQFETPKAPFFYCPKTSKAERDRGLPKGTNKHPTVKPLKLLRWLVKLVTPKGGTVLDPFAGSGTTCLAALEEGFQFIGIERDPESQHVATLRTTRKRDIFDELAELDE